MRDGTAAALVCNARARALLMIAGRRTLRAPTGIAIVFRGDSGDTVARSSTLGAMMVPTNALLLAILIPVPLSFAPFVRIEDGIGRRGTELGAPSHAGMMTTKSVLRRDGTADALVSNALARAILMIDRRGDRTADHRALTTGDSGIREQPSTSIKPARRRPDGAGDTG